MPSDLEPSTAALLREFVAALPQGIRRGWRYEDRDEFVRTDVDEAVVPVVTDEEGRFIAAMSPPVVLALADLLEHLKALGRDHATLDRTDLDAYIADTLAATRALDAALRRSQP